MRILQVVPSYLPATRYGGPIIAVHGLARSLVARGHEVTVFTTNVNGPESSDVPLDRDVLLDGVRIRYFAASVSRRLYCAPAMARALGRETNRFDLVHTHSVFLWPTWAASRAAAARGVPSVLSPRGMLVKDLISRRSRIVKTCWLSLIERHNLARAAAVHVTSELEKSELLRFGWRVPPIVTIANGIDEPEEAGGPMSEDVARLTKAAPFALFLGRLSWKKGIDRLLRAFALTRAGALVIAGNDDEAIAPSLRAQIEDLGLSPRVTLLPRGVHGADKEALFAHARAFVLASYSENFGNTVIEAMLRGVPAIVTPEVGASEIVVRAGGGLVVSGDEATFAAAIGRLLSDAELAHDLGESGRRYVRHHLTWRALAERMESFYQDVRGSHENSRVGAGTAAALDTDLG